MKEILETITEWMTHQDDSVMGDYIAHKQLALRLEPPINEEVERRIAERMPSENEIETWAMLDCGGCSPESCDERYGIIRGMKLLRSRLTSSEKPNNTEQQMWRDIQEGER